MKLSFDSGGFRSIAMIQVNYDFLRLVSSHSLHNLTVFKDAGLKITKDERPCIQIQSVLKLYLKSIS